MRISRFAAAGVAGLLLGSLVLSAQTPEPRKITVTA
jgi:hypothetical protein